MIIFETARLVVRNLHKEDSENFFLVNGDEEVTRYIRPVKTREESDLFLLKAIKEAEETPLLGRWAIEEKKSRQFVGTFVIIPVDQTEKMQLGYALIPSSWGKGYATELTKAALFYIFTQTDLPEIYAITEVPNNNSRKVLTKAGFGIEKHYPEGVKQLIRYVLSKENFLKLP